MENTRDSNKRLPVSQITVETETRFPRCWYWGLKSSRLWSWVAESFIPDISKEHAENVNGLCLRNVGNLQPNYSVVLTPQTWTLYSEITSYNHQEGKKTLNVWKGMVWGTKPTALERSTLYPWTMTANKTVSNQNTLSNRKWWIWIALNHAGKELI